MADLFGGKWERENGITGSDKFFVWADKIEGMPKEQLRRRFDALEHKFKKDVSEGRDIWPPSVAQFMALNGNPRVNEQAYRQHVPALRPKTVEEYSEIAEKKRKQIRDELGF